MDSLVMEVSPLSLEPVIHVSEQQILHTNILSLSFPVPSDYVIALNATVYYADIHIGHPLNTPVFRIRAFFSSPTTLGDTKISLSQSIKVNTLFEFKGGTNNMINIVSANLTSVGGGHSVFDTSINLVEHPNTEFEEGEYPATLMMAITLLQTSQQTVNQVTSEGIGSIQGEKKLVFSL